MAIRAAKYLSREAIMSLLSSEQKAADFVSEIGIERATTILNAICRRIDRRYDAACQANPHTPINREWVRQTDLERELIHRLKMGLMLVDDYLTPTKAHERILARIAARNANRKNKPK
jgi:hypothetical protein